MNTITEIKPEWAAQFPAHNQKWIDNAMSCEAMTDEDRRITEHAIREMYKVANLPEPKHVVFVPSPLVAAFAGSFAAGIWWLHKNPKQAAEMLSTGDATYDVINATTAATEAAVRNTTEAVTHVTYTATRAAAYAVTYASTYAATNTVTRNTTEAATDAVTYTATRAATRAVTYTATRAATCDATRAVTYAATRDATYAATNSTFDATFDATRATTDADQTPLVRYLLGCCQYYYRMWQGGNQWAGDLSFLSSFRDIYGLRLPQHAAYHWYETAALYSGPRMVHADFCIVSDRPKTIAIDGNNVPHCEDGPSHEWRDGWKLWHIHGVKVDEQIVMRPETQTIEQIESEPNEEVRRIRIERYGWLKYLAEVDAQVIESRLNDIDNTKEVLLRLKDESQRIVCSCRSTGRVYAIGVPRDIKTCESAQVWMGSGDWISRKHKTRIIGAS